MMTLTIRGHGRFEVADYWAGGDVPQALWERIGEVLAKAGA